MDRTEHVSLEGKVALITGAGRGLGAMVCEVLSEAGTAIVAADIVYPRAEAVAEALRRQRRRALALRLDVADEAQARKAVEQVVAEFGRLDVLVNNAGIDVTQPVTQLALADWDRVLAVNLRGPFILSQLALSHMQARGNGHIVNVVSTAAKRAWANTAAYHASKWGLLGFSHALHVEARAVGVKVTAVISGGMRTDFLFERFPDIDPELLQDPRTVAETIRFVLTQPAGSVIPELMVLPMRENSWP